MILVLWKGTNLGSVCPIASQAIWLKMSSSHSGCFFKMRALRGSAQVWNRRKVLKFHVIGVELWYSWMVGGGSKKCGCVWWYSVHSASTSMLSRTVYGSSEMFA